MTNGYHIVLIFEIQSLLTKENVLDCGSVQLPGFSCFFFFFFNLHSSVKGSFQAGAKWKKASVFDSCEVFLYKDYCCDLAIYVPLFGPLLVEQGILLLQHFIVDRTGNLKKNYLKDSVVVQGPLTVFMELLDFVRFPPSPKKTYLVH